MTDLSIVERFAGRLLNVRGRVNSDSELVPYRLDQFERRNWVSPRTINFLDARLTRVMYSLWPMPWLTPGGGNPIAMVSLGTADRRAIRLDETPAPCGAG